MRSDTDRVYVDKSTSLAEQTLNRNHVCSVTVNIDGEEVRYFHAVKEGVDRVFVDHPWFLAKVKFATPPQVP